MDLKEKTQDVSDRVNTLTDSLEKSVSELNKLKESVQPNNSELYTNMSKYVRITEKLGSYEYILGGDGRSCPWSETRRGIIVTGSIKKGVYLSEHQNKIVKQYIEETSKFDHIEIVQS